ncbi:BnaCnng16840D [Brassica napus]|uniref:BnaA01g28020D protein n=1 Tax=Brassica napus TaxID=3708 RepID=A0A078I9S6_BRANA|nr:BnaA01g28020D [Brassica napus]CDY46903.1 BnaA01g28030D [Brassica napus]CDY48707.1 BnaCnng16840D [Brassica napus]
MKVVRGMMEESREQQLQRDVREEVRELAKAQADGTEVISDPIDADQWLAAVHGMQEDQGDNSKQTESKGTSNPKLGH